MKIRIFDFLKRYAVALAWVYFTVLLGWLALYLIFGSGRGYLDVVNNLAVYLFFPLPLIAAITLITRRRELVAGTLLGGATFLWYWGILFMPGMASASNLAAQPELTVMTYNVLGLHAYVDPIVDVIRTENADVVCLQEVNPQLAATLQTELADEYLYQILDPQEGVHGMGILSRYPLVAAEAELPLSWVGVPQIFELDWNGATVLLVNFHSLPYSFGSRSNYSAFQAYRQGQAEALRTFAVQVNQPLIMAGDANDTFLSGTYQTIMDSGLKDAWREAGVGLGHTFPGSDIPGSSRWKIGNWSIPQWLTRIDYIFVSPQWEVRSARVAQFDGVSDHRGVVAKLVLGE